MGEIANIIGFPAFPARRKVVPTAPVVRPEFPGLSRLIPGELRKHPDTTEVLIRVRNQTPRSLGVIDYLCSKELLIALTPRFLQRLHPAMIIPAAVDLALVIWVGMFERRLFAPYAETLSAAAVCIYAAVFLVFGMEEDLYAGFRHEAAPEMAAVLRVVGWATLFAASTTWSVPRGLMFSLLSFSGTNLCVLLTVRQVVRLLRVAENPRRNVLIVGNGPHAQQIAQEIQKQQESVRTLKGFIAEHHLRNVYGASMLRRIAREEFIDELIIASSDPAVARIAITEGHRNALDVRIVPDIAVLPLTKEIAFEKVGCLPLLKLEDHPAPEYALAMKRAVDIVIALCGLVVLTPGFLVIAAGIKLDSKGPVLYRAPRTGRKGRKFVCYKFRTMAPDADFAKDGLRTANERDGAFFKISNDPRVTRVGRFLRRYSLDELPQLWNVLRGDMSLVGPRPHPLDDVSRYETHHLQRLDFVPGLTGLWQVTARRDPSFDRSVALDVEYIRSWSLWLDARILWRTIFVVLQGSGA